MDTEEQRTTDAQRAARRKPTLRTIAEATGFAVTTVSRALADDPRIAKTTRRTVAEAAERLGYVPDRAAQRLRTGRTRVISLLINPEHEFLGFMNELLDGLVSALKGTDYAISIVPDFIRGDRVEAIRNILRNRLADGIVFTRTECFDPRVRLLLEHDFPFVTHGRTEFTTPHPFVDFDNEAFAREAVRHLVARGRRRLSMIPPAAKFTFSQHLRYGFISAAREAGVTFELPDDVSLDSQPSEVIASLARRRGEPDAPDGYVCVGEVMAMATMAMLTDAGIAVGSDVDVVAKRASPVFDFYRPRIETVLEDVRATGQLIGDHLLRRLAGEDVAQLQTIQHPRGRFSGSS